MALKLAQTSISSHLVDGDLTPGSEIALRIGQTLLRARLQAEPARTVA
jgi:aconitate hydratase